MNIDKIEDYFLYHKDIMLSVYNQLSCDGKFFPTDIYTTTIINRAMAINEAYVKLANENNYITAASFIRMQMDNCLCCYAIVLVKDVFGLVNHFVSGKDLYKLKDKKKNCLYEKYIVQEINKHFKNFKKAYDFYNRDIHLSYKHFIMAFNEVDNHINLAFNSDNAYSEYDIKSYNENMRIFNKILIKILLSAWLPYKKNQLEYLKQIQTEQNLSYEDSIKYLLKDYPEITQLLFNHHKS